MSRLTEGAWMSDRKDLGLADDQFVIYFAPSQKLPDGWYVIRLDSGHYMATNKDGSVQSCITVNRFHARQWAIQLSKKVTP